MWLTFIGLSLQLLRFVCVLHQTGVNQFGSGCAVRVEEAGSGAEGGWTASPHSVLRWSLFNHACSLDKSLSK